MSDPFTWLALLALIIASYLSALTSALMFVRAGALERRLDERGVEDAANHWLVVDLDGVRLSNALVRTVGDEFARYAKVRKNIPEEALTAVAESDEPAKLADLVAGHLGIEVDQKQDLLETLTVSERLEKVYGLMQGELSVLQVEKKIKTRVKSQMEKTQREYYLNEQMKAIQRELGDGEEGAGEVAELVDAETGAGRVVGTLDDRVNGLSSFEGVVYGLENVGDQLLQIDPSTGAEVGRIRLPDRVGVEGCSCSSRHSIVSRGGRWVDRSS